MKVKLLRADGILANHTKWRRSAKRPSCLDLITLLRKEITEHPEMLVDLDLKPSHRALTTAAAA